MRIKMALWILAFAAMGLLMTQNKDFFMERQALHLNLYYERFQLPELPVAVIFLFAFMLGVFLSSISYFKDRLVTNRNVKRLENAVDTCYQKVSDCTQAMVTAKSDAKT